MENKDVQKIAKMTIQYNMQKKLLNLVCPLLI